VQVITYETLWLLASPFLYLAIYLFFVWLARLVTHSARPVRELALDFAYPLLPIALVYNITHYSTLILTQGVASIDDAYDPHFAMISFGAAGIRVFDIRDPYVPSEVAYYNLGSLAHDGVSWYDAARGLMLIPSSGLKVLEIEPQVFDALGMPHPSDPAYPRFLPEPGFALSLGSGLALLATLRRWQRPRRVGMHRHSADR